MKKILNGSAQIRRNRMKSFMVFLLTLLQVYTPVYAQQSVGKVVEGTAFPGIYHQQNYVKNPGAEKNINNLTLSAAIVTRSTSSPLLGSASFSIDGTSSGQTVKFDTSTLDNLLSGKNCETRFDYSGDGSLYKAYVEQGSTKVTADLTLLNVSSGAQAVSIDFPCGNLASNSHLVIETTSASAAAIKVDNVYLGAATNLTNISQMKNNILLSWTGTQTASHDTDNQVTFSGGATVTTLTGFTHDGSGTFTSLIAGSCIAHWAVRQQYANDAAAERQRFVKIYKNGTVHSQAGNLPGISGNNQNSGGVPTGSNLNANGYVEMSSVIPVAIGDVLTLYYYQANGNGSSRTIDGARLDVSCMPAASQLALTPNNTPSYWVGYHDTTCGWTRTNASFGDLTADATCALIQRKASNISCVATGSVLPALSCTFPKAGAYKVCAQFMNYNNTSNSFNTFRLYDGTSTLVESDMGNPSTINTIGFSGNICGVLDVTGTTGTVTLQGKTSSGGTMTVGPVTTNPIEWIVEPLAQNNAAPLLVGGVTSSSTGAVRHEFFRGTCSTSSSLGSSSIQGATIGNITAGCCDIAIPATYAFSSTTTHSCPISLVNAGTASGTVMSSSFFSTTGITVCASTGGTTTANFQMNCSGPR
jgi:hypothetical protein